MYVSVNESGKIIFSRTKRHGYGKVYTDKDLDKAAKKISEFWSGEHDIYGR